MIDDYAQVTARALVEPYTPDLRALVRVCGDRLEQDGDPRGTLIALGEAHLDARGRDRHALQHAVDMHVLEHHLAEVGAAAPLLAKPRTLALAWRCGQLFGARLDMRRLPRADLHTAMRNLLEAPAAASLRRLAIRVRQVRDLDAPLAVLRERAWPAPLEHLLVLTSVRPQRFGGVALAMGTQFPHLFCYAHGDAVCSLLDLPLQTSQLHAITAPLDPTTRTLLGRCLTHPEPAVRAAALDQVAILGEHAAIYVELLGLLLQPHVFPTPARVVAALRAIGPAARSASDVLARVPGRVKHYDTATRKAAGSLVASLREP